MRTSERGFLLMMALAIVVLLALAAGGLSYWVTTEHRLARMDVGRFVAESAAESAIQQGLQYLRRDPKWRPSAWKPIEVDVVRDIESDTTILSRYVLSLAVVRDPDILRLTGRGETVHGAGRGVKADVHQTVVLTRPTLYGLVARHSIRLGGPTKVNGPLLAGRTIEIAADVDVTGNMIAGRDVSISAWAADTVHRQVRENENIVFFDPAELSRYLDSATKVSDQAHLQDKTVSNQILYYAGHLTLRNTTLSGTTLLVDGSVTIEQTFAASPYRRLPALYVTGDVYLDRAAVSLQGLCYVARVLHGEGRMTVKGALVADEIDIVNFDKERSSFEAVDEFIESPVEGFEGEMVIKDFSFQDG